MSMATPIVNEPGPEIGDRHVTRIVAVTVTLVANGDSLPYKVR